MPNVILIDDDPVFASLVRRRLEQDGHVVDFNSGAFGALTAVRQKTYDVILVDVQMPGIGGPKLVEFMRDRGVGHARIILMSSVAEEELRRAMLAHGAHAYFCKGWGVDRLAFLIRQARH
jgi:CheY-like chemotaxis protein